MAPVVDNTAFLDQNLGPNNVVAPTVENSPFGPKGLALDSGGARNSRRDDIGAHKLGPVSVVAREMENTSFELNIGPRQCCGPNGGDLAFGAKRSGPGQWCGPIVENTPFGKTLGAWTVRQPEKWRKCPLYQKFGPEQ